MGEAPMRLDEHVIIYMYFVSVFCPDLLKFVIMDDENEV